MTTSKPADAEHIAVVREATACLAEARALQNKNPFTKEDSARVESLIRMAEFLLPEGQRAVRSIKLLTAERKSGLDEATREQEFNRYLRSGLNGLELEAKDRLFQHKASWAKAEVRAPQATTPGPVGGFLVPEAFESRITHRMKAFPP
jgi:HK97 family phage major capsid protein